MLRGLRIEFGDVWTGLFNGPPADRSIRVVGIVPPEMDNGNAYYRRWRVAYVDSYGVEREMTLDSLLSGYAPEDGALKR